MAQHAILRFEKHKGNPGRPLDSHHERQKEQYASNPETWSVGKVPAKQAGNISPPGCSSRRFPSPNRQEPLKPPLTVSIAALYLEN